MDLYVIIAKHHAGRAERAERERSSNHYRGLERNFNFRGDIISKGDLIYKGGPNFQREHSTREKFLNEFPKYIHIGEILNYNPADTSVNEPAMFIGTHTYNSKENLKAILQHLKMILIDNGDGRQWVFVGADGPPYTILRQIVMEEPAVYDWVILVSGKGHFEYEPT